MPELLILVILYFVKSDTEVTNLFFNIDVPFMSRDFEAVLHSKQNSAGKNKENFVH